MTEPRHNAERAARRAAVIPSTSDTRLPRQFVEALMQAWVRDAYGVGEAPSGGVLLAHAAEAAEFGAADVDRAAQLYTTAAAHADADPRAFAGRRRALRSAGDEGLAGLASVYEDELDAATTAPQKLCAGIGLAQEMLRAKANPANVLGLLEELSSLVPRAPAEVGGLYRRVLEDALILARRDDDALKIRARRHAELALLGDAVDETTRSRSARALAIATARLGGTREAELAWYETAFEADRDEHALRQLVRAACDAGDMAGAAALIGEFVNAEDDSGLRSRYQYELGMLRAGALDDRPGALGALGESMKAGLISPLSATSFLALARTSQGSVVTDEFVDALGASLDFAASGVERAELLVQMARRFDGELHMTEAAVELAREALAEAPGYTPAIRILGDICTRTGRWSELVVLGELELERADNDDDRVRLHERLADLLVSELHDPVAGEKHLRAALDLRAHLPVVRRLARLLAEQYRWDELYEHLVLTAGRLPDARERAYLYEQAGDVAESRLRDQERAITAWRALLALRPTHSTAVASLGRLLSQSERWDELLELNEFELEQGTPGTTTRVAILTRSAEIARRQLGDLSLAERYLRRALDEDPTFDEALRGLGALLKAQQRWSELVEMTERELAAASSERQRVRCLRRLGELHALRLGQPATAATYFERLVEQGGQVAEEALVWLERLYQAAGRVDEVLRVLHVRFERCDEPSSRGRIAFRIAETNEWIVRDVRTAFEGYIEALADDIAAPVALRCLDRLWMRGEIDDELRHGAVRCISDAAERDDVELRRAALTFLAERAAPLFDATSQATLWDDVVTAWPDDLVAAENVAIDAVRAGDQRLAEALRRNALVGPLDVALDRWAALDTRTEPSPVGVDPAVLPAVAGWLAREEGTTAALFDGAHERELFARIGSGRVSLADLRAVDDSETGLRLGAMACRALGDGEGLRQCWLTLARSLEPELRAMRAWLDLAAEDEITQEERRTWLTEAASLGCYDAPVRTDLYQALSAAHEIALLESSIAEHLAQAPPEPARAAELALRRGRALEVLGDRDGAIDALRYAAIHAPGDAAIALEKARLETLADRLDEARESLEACLDAGVDGDARVDVLGRIADVHQMEGGNRRRALAALEDAWELSGRSREWGTRLASAHAGFGQPERCVQLLEAVLPDPMQVGDIHHWQLLARVYASHLERRDEAEDILWGLFERFADRRSTLAGLEEFYRRHAGADVFAERLSTTLAENRLQLDAQHVAELWIYVGELEFSVLRRYREAEQAFAHARSLVGPQAGTLLREARAAGRQTGRVRDAARMVVGALELSSNDVRLWEGAALELETLYGELQDASRLRVARQLRSALGANVETEEEWVKRDPTRELEADLAWGLLGRDILAEDERVVLQAFAPLAEKVFARNAPSRKQYRGRKLRGGDELSAFEAYLNTASTWLGVQPPKVMVGNDRFGAVALDAGTFWLSTERISNDTPLRARFWAGYLAALTFSGLAPFTWTDELGCRDLITAVASRTLGGEFVAASTLDDEVGGLLLTPQRRQAAAVLREYPEVAQRGGHWAETAVRLADRAGLLMCGDLRIAVEELLTLSSWDANVAEARTREAMVSDARISALMRYALSDDYYLARYESGLGQRPWIAD